MNMSQSGEIIWLTSASHKLKLTRNKSYAYLDVLNDGVPATKLSFAFALSESGGHPLISQTDMALLVDSIFRDWSLQGGPIRKIVLDAGHGGRDQGAPGARSKEKELNLILTRKVRDILKSKGFTVLMTRESDVDMTLSKRAALCRQWNGDLFVSVHHNQAGARSAHGIETFAMTPRGATSFAGGKPSYKTYTGNKYDKDNARLAFELQRYMVGMTGGEDRGVKYARFQVLREVDCPAALVECGFLSNRTEEGKLLDSRYQNAMATAIANGIIAYRNAVIRGYKHRQGLRR
jgi:N-acetylmuramoyl-L-alanine amidase